MTGTDLTRALNRNRSGLTKMLVVAEQLDKLIGYTSGWTIISKDLKQGLLKLRKSLALAKKEYDLLVEERSAAEASREERSPNGQFLFDEPAEETRPKKKEKFNASASNQPAKPVAKCARGRETKPQQANPRKHGVQPDQGKQNPWITVGKKEEDENYETSPQTSEK